MSMVKKSSNLQNHYSVMSLFFLDKLLPQKAPIENTSNFRSVPYFDLALCSILINVLGLALPLMMLQIYDRIIPNQGESTLAFLALGTMLIVFVDFILRFLRSYLTAWSGAYHEHKININNLYSILTTDHESYNKKSSSKRLEQMQSVQKLRDFYSGQGFLTFIDLPFSVIYLGAIFYIGGSLFLIPAASILCMIGIFSWRLSKQKEIYNTLDKIETKRTNILLQSFKNIQTIKAQAMEKSLIRPYEKTVTEFVEETYEVNNKKSTSVFLMQFFSQLSIIILASFGALMVMQGQLSLGGLAGCTLLCGRLMQPLQKALQLWDRLYQAQLSLSNVVDIHNLQQVKKITLPAVTGADAVGCVDIKNMSFRYSESAPFIIKNIDLSIFSGDVIAIQGKTGVGKTTLLSLISGQMPPTDGVLALDGFNIHEIDLQNTDHGISYLPQYPKTYHGTILENITMFRRDTHRFQARHVAKIVGLDETVLKLSKGYNTVIGKGKADPLPEGMMKRISLARALLDPTRLIIFDEADSNLDQDGRQYLQSLIQSLVGQCTIVIASKDPWIFNLTNRCYRLDDQELFPVDRSSLISQSIINNKDAHSSLKKGSI